MSESEHSPEPINQYKMWPVPDQVSKIINDQDQLDQISKEYNLDLQRIPNSHTFPVKPSEIFDTILEYRRLVKGIRKNHFSMKGELQGELQGEIVIETTQNMSGDDQAFIIKVAPNTTEPFEILINRYDLFADPKIYKQVPAFLDLLFIRGEKGISINPLISRWETPEALAFREREYQRSAFDNEVLLNIEESPEDPGIDRTQITKTALSDLLRNFGNFAPPDQANLVTNTLKNQHFLFLSKEDYRNVTSSYMNSESQDVKTSQLPIDLSHSSYACVLNDAHMLVNFELVMESVNRNIKWYKVLKSLSDIDQIGIEKITQLKVKNTIIPPGHFNVDGFIGEFYDEIDKNRQESQGASFIPTTRLSYEELASKNTDSDEEIKRIVGNSLLYGIIYHEGLHELGQDAKKYPAKTEELIESGINYFTASAISSKYGELTAALFVTKAALTDFDLWKRFDAYMHRFKSDGLNFLLAADNRYAFLIQNQHQESDGYDDIRKMFQ